MEIQGHEKYLIYPDGRVQNKITKRIMKVSLCPKGYSVIAFKKDNIRSAFKIHRLVAIHYIPNPDNKKEVDHINRIKNDNRIENLRWCDRTENLMNQVVRKNNKLGIKNICFLKGKSKYQFKKCVYNITYRGYFNTLTEALCYKFIILLKIKSLLISRKISS